MGMDKQPRLLTLRIIGNQRLRTTRFSPSYWHAQLRYMILATDIDDDDVSGGALSPSLGDIRGTALGDKMATA
jgi:hypothetical protein